MLDLVTAPYYEIKGEFKKGIFKTYSGLYLWRVQEFKIVEEVGPLLHYFAFLGKGILLQLFWIPVYLKNPFF